MKKVVLLIATCGAVTALTACGGSAKNATESAKSAASSASSTLSQQATEASGAKTNSDGSVTKTCTVTGVPNVTPDKVDVEVTSKGKATTAAVYLSCPSATPVVQMTARLKAEKPIQAGPFNCTPTVTGNKANFTCTLTVSNAVAVTYKFALNYKS